ncbi:MAG: hypothetical protein ACRDZ7_05660 [Acidimicrobiia bacterium]
MAQQSEPDDLPSPSLVAAWLVVDRLDPASVPTSAAWWLVQGHDGEALRQLAGLSGQDPWDVRELLPSALADIGVALPTPAEAVRLAFEHEAKACLAGKVDERTVARFVENVYIDSDYASWVLDEPLGEIYGVDDEWEGRWGRLEDDLRKAVRAACAAQLEIE